MTPRRHIALGLLFLTAVGILSYYTLFKTDFSLFEEKQSLVAFAEDARGLRKGAPVLYAGVRWGKVDSVEPDLERPREERVRIGITLDEPIRLFADHRVTIESASVLGGVQLGIDPGRVEAGEVDTSIPLLASSAPDVLAALGQVVDENRESLRQSIAGIEAIVETLNGTEGTIGRLINDKKTADDVSDAIEGIKGTFDNVTALTEELRGGQGTIGKLIYDDVLYKDFQEFVKSLDQATKDISTLLADAKDVKGLIGTLIYDTEVADGVRNTVDSIESAAAKIDEGDGTIAKLLNEPDVADDIQGFLKAWTNPEGTIGRLLNEDDIYEDAQSLFADLADAGAAIREQRGTLGILLHDDELIDEVTRAIQVLTGALEEQREAAPIATFLSTVFLGV